MPDPEINSDKFYECAHTADDSSSRKIELDVDTRRCSFIFELSNEKIIRYYGADGVFETLKVIYVDCSSKNKCK